MIKEVAHIGITVNDMEESIHFYKDILGLKFVGELIMEGDETDALFQQKNVKARVCYFNGSDEIMTPPIELIEFINPKIKKDSSNLFKTSISEICFKVIDIESTYQRLAKLGVTFLSKPQEFDFKKYGFSTSKAVYFKDSNNIILELIQDL